MNIQVSTDGRAASPPILQAALGVSHPGSAQDLFIRVLDAMFALHDRAEARRRLGRLDDRMLHDIGVDRATADVEAGKPFWRR